MVLPCADRKRSHRCDDSPTAMSEHDWRRSPVPEAHPPGDEDLGACARSPEPSRVQRSLQLQLEASASQTSGGRVQTLPRVARKTECAFPTSLERDDRANSLPLIASMDLTFEPSVFALTCPLGKLAEFDSRRTRQESSPSHATCSVEMAMRR